MATDMDTLRVFLRQVEQWPPEDRANLSRVAEILEAAHPTLYAALMEYLKDAPMALVHPYAEAALNVPAEHRPWFRLLVMELRERARKDKA
jgi:hypothetical protein